MSIFDGVIAITIDEGDVVKIGKDTSNVELKGICINAYGTLYNGCGYKAGTRMNSSGGETEDAGYCVTGYIPYRGGSIVVSGSVSDVVNTGGQYLMAYDENFNWLQHHSIGSMVDSGFVSYGLQEDGFYGFELTSLPADWVGVAYFRTSIKGDVDNLSVKIKNIETLWEKPASYTNQVPISINADGTIYNGVGYKNGYRVRSGGAEAENGVATCTGFIPAKGNDMIRMSGILLNTDSGANAINVYDASYNCLGQVVENYANAGYGIFDSNGKYTAYCWNSGFESPSGVFNWTVPPDAGIAYIRVTGRTGGAGSKLIVTINEEIEV